MANDRVFIKCKACGGWKMLLKHYPPTGPTTRGNNILDWLDDHRVCHPHRFDSDLQGDPGFTLHTDDDLGIDGCLLPSKQTHCHWGLYSGATC